jgi:hypothetical protein
VGGCVARLASLCTWRVLGAPPHCATALGRSLPAIRPNVDDSPNVARRQKEAAAAEEIVNEIRSKRAAEAAAGNQTAGEDAAAGAGGGGGDAGAAAAGGGDAAASATPRIGSVRPPGQKGPASRRIGAGRTPGQLEARDKGGGFWGSTTLPRPRPSPEQDPELIRAVAPARVAGPGRGGPRRGA